MDAINFLYKDRNLFYISDDVKIPVKNFTETLILIFDKYDFHSLFELNNDEIYTLENVELEPIEEPCSKWKCGNSECIFECLRPTNMIKTYKI